MRTDARFCPSPPSHAPANGAARAVPTCFSRRPTLGCSINQ
ncbi:hypothetical protein C7S16_1068 [Burkholderia thailandensis]|uniref:Uncharacterized protein n=1 Tax=Burkholderia thailandensis TaxID=57975 RepID=A0AAW9D6R0_BURTH|nr:hypothetical protein [Burkholderia thailandensis]MDW9257506.1 hypothetical protein [Burkholderia thailandensis]